LATAEEAISWAARGRVGGCQRAVVAEPVGVAGTDELERRCQAILCPDPRWRGFALDAAFAAGERVARTDSATGDRWPIWFSPKGVVSRGFDHESPVSPWGREPIVAGGPAWLIRAVGPAADTAVVLATAKAVGHPVAG
jgi:hypothetical protein